MIGALGIPRSVSGAKMVPIILRTSCSVLACTARKPFALAKSRKRSCDFINAFQTGLASLLCAGVISHRQRKAQRETRADTSKRAVSRTAPENPSPADLRKKGIAPKTDKIQASFGVSSMKKNKDLKLKELRMMMGANRKKKTGPEMFFLGENTRMEAQHFSSGSLALDLILGGGIPRGRTIEVFGTEASGKTTLALTAMREIQKEQGVAAYVDMEQAVSPEYAEAIGVNLKELVFCQPNSAEAALDMVQKLAESENVDAIVLDSIAALIPQEEQEKDMASPSMALTARLMGKHLRKLLPVANKNNVTVIYINQLRSNLGGYGPSEDTPGGKAMKYTSSIRMELRSPKSGMLGSADNPYGMTTKVSVKKNKLAPPHKKTHFDIFFGKGIDKGSDLFECGKRIGLIQAHGPWLSYGEKKVKGKKKFIKWMLTEPGVVQKLEKDIKSQHFTKTKGTGPKLQEDVQKDKRMRQRPGFPN